MDSEFLDAMRVKGNKLIREGLERQKRGQALLEYARHIQGGGTLRARAFVSERFWFNETMVADLMTAEAQHIEH